jgi:hypothetical protein
MTTGDDATLSSLQHPRGEGRWSWPLDTPCSCRPGTAAGSSAKITLICERTDPVYSPPHLALYRVKAFIGLPSQLEQGIVAPLTGSSFRRIAKASWFA